MAAFLATTVGYYTWLAVAVIVAIAVSAVVTAYFQIYLAEFAVDSIDKTQKIEEKEESDFII